MSADRPLGAYYRQDITEEHSFDELAKGLADSTLSRWHALRVLSGALVGTVLGFYFLGEAWAQSQGVEGA